MKSPDIRIGKLSQVTHANKVKIHNQNHILEQKKVDKATLQNNLMSDMLRYGNIWLAD